MRIIAVVLIPLLTTSCDTVFDALIPKAPHSKADAPEVVCVSFPEALEELLPAAIGVAAPIVIGIVVDQVAKGLEAEAKQYKASYSGRASSYLLKVSPATDQQLPPKIELLHRRLRIDRYHGEISKKHGCPEKLSEAERAELTKAIAAERVMSFQAEMTASEGLDAIRIRPTLFELKDAKAKVSLFKQTVDVNVQVTLTTLLKSAADAPAKQVDIAQIDFPIGKLKLSDQITPPALSQLQSGWYALPKLQIPPLPPPPPAQPEYTMVGPLNVTITVMESDDFGDVIGQGAKLVTDNKTKIVEELLKILGLKEDQKASKP